MNAGLGRYRHVGLNPLAGFDMPGCLHDMGRAGEEFQTKLLEAIQGTFQP